MKFKQMMEGIKRDETYTCALFKGHVYLDSENNLKIFTFNKLDYSNFVETFNDLLKQDWYREDSTGQLDIFKDL